MKQRWSDLLKRMKLMTAVRFGVQTSGFSHYILHLNLGEGCSVHWKVQEKTQESNEQGF